MTNIIVLFVIFTFVNAVNKINKRVVILHWKAQKNDPFEVFSNLKNLCLSYPQYNYNTLNNYLSKEKVAYENDIVRIERKNIISQPKKSNSAKKRMIVPVVRKIKLKDAHDAEKDLEYWLLQPVSKRLEAVTFLISQSLKPGERMDKTFLRKRKMKA